jgi:hypothetical protein
MKPLISSFIFTTNIITAYLYKKYYIYSTLFGALTTTSVLFYSNNNIYTNIIDKCAIGAVVLYGGYMLYNKITMDNLHRVLLICASFISVLILFFGDIIIKNIVMTLFWVIITIVYFIL